ncbi:hypothetical protein ACKKBF_B14345 [Auxenochlorella protothecoides x Auxenochlorella symbiontica]
MQGSTPQARVHAHVHPRFVAPRVLNALPPHHIGARPRNRSSRAGPVPASLVVEGIQYATGVGIALGIALSSLPILSGEAREANERRYLQPTEEEEANSIRWGVMSVLSFIPYLSPLAWVFAGLDDETYSSLYYVYAALYTLPYLTNGLQLNSFVLLSIAAGIAHVQLHPSPLRLSGWR